MSRVRDLIAAGLSLAATLPLYAHHSPAAYDLAAQVTIEGTVTDFEWANPHAYVSLKESMASGEERVWQVELFSPSALKQYGWTPTTLVPGDRITITASPGRNRTRNIAFLHSLEKAGTLLLDARVMLSGGGGAPRSDAAPRFSAKSIAGVWATLPGPALGQLLGGAAALPTTPEGAAAIRDFTDAAGPASECVPFAPPVYMILPVFRSIEIGGDKVVIRGEENGVERTIHLNRSSHDGAPASVQGDSTGRWEGDVLVVDTTQFTQHRLGNAAGLPSSPAKHLVERFQLTPNGAGLTYTFTLEDPQYLTAAVQGMSPWSYRPDVTFAPIECSLQNARKFLGE